MVQSTFLITWVKIRTRGRRMRGLSISKCAFTVSFETGYSILGPALVPNLQVAPVYSAAPAAIFLLVCFLFSSEWCVFLIGSLLPDKIQQLAHFFHTGALWPAGSASQACNHPVLHSSILVRKVSTIFLCNFGIPWRSICNWRHFVLLLASAA